MVCYQTTNLIFQRTPPSHSAPQTLSKTASCSRIPQLLLVLKMIWGRKCPKTAPLGWVSVINGFSRSLDSEKMLNRPHKLQPSPPGHSLSQIAAIHWAKALPPGQKRSPNNKWFGHLPNFCATRMFVCRWESRQGKVRLKAMTVRRRMRPVGISCRRAC